MLKMVRGFLSVAIMISIAFAVLVSAQDLSPVKVENYTGAIKLACVGDSITQGVGAGRGQSWPHQIARMLGEKWEVKNFGVSGTTLMNSGNAPYQKRRAFSNAKDFNPDVVVIMLGTNDTKPGNFKHFEKDFEADYRDMIKQFAELKSKPRIFVCRPPYIAKTGNWGINERDTLKEIPVIDKLAKDLKLGLVDVHAALKDKDAMIPDNVHPNKDGAAEIAGAVFKALTGKEALVGAK